MSDKTLARDVIVYDEGGNFHTLDAGSTPPDWAAAQINDPGVYVDEAPESEVDFDGPPPMGGAGSGADAWRGYAAGAGVEVAADASRDDIVAALQAADVATV